MLFNKSSNIAVIAALLACPASAFIPSNRPSHAAARKSSLSMSAALIVQNKGGGHGELGTLDTLSETYLCLKHHTSISNI